MPFRHLAHRAGRFAGGEQEKPPWRRRRQETGEACGRMHGRNRGGEQVVEKRAG